MKFSFIKKHLIWSSVAVLIVIIIVLSVVFGGGKKEEYETAVVSREDLNQTVEVTGKIKPTEERDLAFERSGTVNSVYASVGDSVVFGQKLVSLNGSELYAQLKQAESAVVQAQNTLIELKRGSRPEELMVYRTAVENAERALEDAKTSYNIVSEKTVTDLLSAYDGAMTSAQSGVVGAKNALVSLSEIQYTRFIQLAVANQNLSDKKAIAIELLFGELGAGVWTANSVSALSGGIYGEMQSIELGITDMDIIYEKLRGVLDALNATSDTLDAMPILTTFSTTEKAELSALKTAISVAIVSLSAKLQVIDVQVSANTSAVAASEAAVTIAKNAFLQAQDQLTLSEAGSTAEAIVAGKSGVDSAIAQKELIEAQIRKTVLTSPINGVVTKQDLKEGVFARAGVIVVSIISENSYEVEVFIPEVDIAKVVLADEVDVTLDAYSDDDIFKATVVSIDPAETVIQGVSTYKVVLDFINKKDDRIRPGMTADAEIMTDSREGVIVVPSRAIVSNGYNYVRVVNRGEIEEREVEVGLRGSNGYSEIISGLSEGETVVTFIRK